MVVVDVGRVRCGSEAGLGVVVEEVVGGVQIAPPRLLYLLGT